jgi:hypothetical protein
VVSIDLWKNNDFRIKDGVLLCFFLIGIRFPVELLLYLFHVDLEILYDMAFLCIVLFIARQFGKKEISAIIKWRNIPAAVFCSLTIMFFGMEVLRREGANILQIILPALDGYFGGWGLTIVMRNSIPNWSQIKKMKNL